MSEQEIDLDERLPPLNMVDGRIPCPNCGEPADRRKEPSTWECPHCRLVWDSETMATVPAFPAGWPLLLPDLDLEKHYRDHHGFRQFTDYLAGLVLSGALLPHEVVGAAVLAGKRSVAAREPAASPLDILERFIRREITYRHWSDAERLVMSRVVNWIEKARRGELP
jgi:hypothetical protein